MRVPERHEPGGTGRGDSGGSGERQSAGQRAALGEILHRWGLARDGTRCGAGARPAHGGDTVQYRLTPDTRRHAACGGPGSDTRRKRLRHLSEPQRGTGRSLPGAHRHATDAPVADHRRTAGAGGSGWCAVPGSELLRPRPSQFAAHDDGLRDGSAARPRIFQARAGTRREGLACSARCWRAWRGRATCRSSR